jgi:hypothetical protein
MLKHQRHRQTDRLARSSAVEGLEENLFGTKLNP